MALNLNRDTIKKGIVVKASSGQTHLGKLEKDKGANGTTRTYRQHVLQACRAYPEWR